jgi:hypothetical protein
MGLINPDTTQMEDFKPVEPATYQGTIASAVPQKSKSKGTPQIELRTKIQVDGKDRTIVDWVITSGPGAFRFDQLLRAVNMNELADKYRAGEQVPFDTEALVGQSLQIVVDKELDQKNPDLERNRVKSYLRA